VRLHLFFAAGQIARDGRCHGSAWLPAASPSPHRDLV
jgi:hypothetical protein